MIRIDWIRRVQVSQFLSRVILHDPTCLRPYLIQVKKKFKLIKYLLKHSIYPLSQYQVLNC